MPEMQSDNSPDIHYQVLQNLPELYMRNTQKEINNLCDTRTWIIFLMRIFPTNKNKNKKKLSWKTHKQKYTAIIYL